MGSDAHIVEDTEQLRTRAALLEERNRTLNDQVRLLVRTEHELYHYRVQLDRQLQRIQALSVFALNCSHVVTPAGIFTLAVDLIRENFDLDQARAVCWPPITGDSSASILSAPELDQTDIAVLSPIDHQPLIVFLNSLKDPQIFPPSSDRERVPGALSHEIFGEDQEPETLTIVPLRIRSSRSCAAIILQRKERRPTSALLESPTEHHLPYLSLFGGHVARELQNALLNTDLRERTVQLAESNQQLRSSLDDLAETQKQLVQSTKMEAIGRLAGGVAHDFNNLLTVILSYADLAADGLEADDPRRTDMDEVTRSAERAAKLTRQLLAFSRQQERRLENLDINELVQDMAKMLSRLIGEDIALEISVDAVHRHLVADRSQLEQIVMNLAVNARDAMPQGGTLTIQTSNQSSDPTSSSVDGSHDSTVAKENQSHRVYLSLQDTGCGMDEATRAQIFEPFFTTKEVGQGTGMGLAMVYGIVQQSEGSISVQSAPDKGARFEIAFPCAENPAEKSRKTRDEAEYLRGSETILVVEDEQSIRQLAFRVLTAQGYDVLVAGNGEEALAVSRRHRPLHLLLTDVVMPKVGGVTLASRITTEIPSIKILFMSGYTGDTLNAHGLASGTMPYLQKPFTPSVLLGAVRKVLDPEHG